MKKLIVGLIMFGLVGSVFAGPHGHHYHGGGNNWIAPALIGGVVGYAIANNRQPVYVNTSPAITGYYPPAVYQPAPQTYRQETILDANCGCYRVVLVPN